MTASLALLLLSVSAAPSKLAAPEWTVNIRADLASFYADEVARVLRAEGFEVITARDMATVLGLERQRQLLGCEEGAESCIAELGAALGCDAILTANLARLDDTFQGSLKVLSAQSGQTLADEPVKATGERALADALEGAARRLARRLRPPPDPGLARRASWIPLAAGVALGAGATAALLVANSNYAKIPASTEPQALGLASDGQGLQVAGWTMAGVGAAAVVGAGLLYFLGGPSPVTPQLSVTNSGAAVGLSGVFP